MIKRFRTGGLQGRRYPVVTATGVWCTGNLKNRFESLWRVRLARLEMIADANQSSPQNQVSTFSLSTRNISVIDRIDINEYRNVLCGHNFT